MSSPAGCTGTWAPELAARLHLLEGLAPHGMGPRSDDEIARLTAFDAPLGDLDLPSCRTRDEVVDGPHGPIPVRVYQASSSTAHDASSAFVWIHGGAFMFGDLDTVEADHSARIIAGLSGATVVSVDYRLAVDGVHHPIPEDDCLAAFDWVRDGGAGPVSPTGGVAVGGASAGACLAAAVALRARDAGTPASQLLLVYPVAHALLPKSSPELAATLAPLPPVMRSIADRPPHVSENYIGGPVSAAQPYAFPGDGWDLEGLPPTYIENCEFDELRASGERFAAQLEAAGVPVECRTACGVGHGHLSIVGSPYARATLERLSRRLTSSRTIGADR